jgi:hypothetical protein
LLSTTIFSMTVSTIQSVINAAMTFSLFEDLNFRYFF